MKGTANRNSVYDVEAQLPGIQNENTITVVITLLLNGYNSKWGNQHELYASTTTSILQEPASGEDAVTTLNGSHDRARAGEMGTGVNIWRSLFYKKCTHLCNSSQFQCPKQEGTHGCGVSWYVVIPSGSTQ